MPSLTLKDVPDALLQRLRDRAANNRRSLNQEVLLLLERAVPRPASADVIAELRALQQEVRAAMVRPLTTEEVRHAIDEGRE